MPSPCFSGSDKATTKAPLFNRGCWGGCLGGGWGGGASSAGVSVVAVGGGGSKAEVDSGSALSDHIEGRGEGGLI